jgi:hypothetical protein
MCVHALWPQILAADIGSSFDFGSVTPNVSSYCQNQDSNLGACTIKAPDLQKLVTEVRACTCSALPGLGGATLASTSKNDGSGVSLVKNAGTEGQCRKSQDRGVGRESWDQGTLGRQSQYRQSRSKPCPSSHPPFFTSHPFPPSSAAQRPNPHEEAEQRVEHCWVARPAHLHLSPWLFEGPDHRHQQEGV